MTIRETGGTGNGGRRAARAVVAGWLAVMPAAWSGDAVAAAAGEQTAQAGPAISFAIPAQDLNRALLAFADTAGVQMLYDVARVEGLRGNPVQGTLPVEEALARLLAGSGVTYRFTGPATIALERVEAGGALVLDPVSVEAAAGFREAGGVGPVGGYVARRTATATKTDTPLRETPQSISVITAEEMKDRGVRTVSDAIKYTPGVQVLYGGSDQRYDWFGLRGFTNANTDANYRDGMRLDDVWYLLPRIDSYTLERVEIMRGPSSVLYGQTPPGGMLNMVTKRPLDTQQAEVAGKVNNFGHLRFEGDATGPLDAEGQWLYRLIAVGMDGDGNTDDTYDNRVLLAPSLTWKPRQGTALTFMAEHQRDDLREGWPGPARWETAAGKAPKGLDVGHDGFSGMKREHTFLSLFGETAVTDDLSLHGSARFGAASLKYGGVWAFGLNGRTAMRWADMSRETQETYTTDAHAQYRWSLGPTANTSIAGVDYAYATGRYTGGGTMTSGINIFTGREIGAWVQPTYTTHYDNSERRVGLYAQNQARIDDRWIVTLGGRQDYMTQDVSTVWAEQSAFTGRAGLGYEFDFGLVPYASYSESFEPQAGRGWGGEYFEPTTGRQYEIGLKYEPAGGGTMLSFAIFDLRKQNALTADPNPMHMCGGSRCQVQKGEVHSRGIELEAKTAITPELTAIASYTFNPVDISKSNDPSEIGRQQADSPVYTAGLWVDYAFRDGPLTGLGLGGGLRLLGATNGWDGTRGSPALIDEVSVRYETGDWRLSLNAENVLDREIELTCSTTATAYQCDLADPLTVTARVARQF